MRQNGMTPGRTWISRLAVGFLTVLIGFLAVPAGLLLTAIYLAGRLAELVIRWRDRDREPEW